MIRPATLDDRMRVLAMAKAFHVASGLPFAFSAPMADALFRASISDADRVCLVYAVDGAAHGVLAAHASSHPFAPIKVAFELIWWIDPEHRGRAGVAMLDAYEDWARSRGCAHINMVGLGGAPLVGRLYERRGFSAVERHFIKSI